MKFMVQSQVSWGFNALNGEVAEASWRTKPSWYLVATDDRMILGNESSHADPHNRPGSTQRMHAT